MIIDLENEIINNLIKFIIDLQVDLIVEKELNYWHN